MSMLVTFFCAGSHAMPLWAVKPFPPHPPYPDGPQRGAFGEGQRNRCNGDVTTPVTGK
jgi:hypothetical protein